jgi:dCTP deaminase
MKNLREDGEGPSSLGGILSGNAIVAAIGTGEIEITPFVPAHVNGASYDIRLGDRFALYDQWACEYSDRPLTFYPTKKVIDIKEKKHFKVSTYQIPEEGIELQPFMLYLMHTHEVVKTTKYEPVLDGKSTVGRVGLFIHVTAAYGDPFFDGQYTLEVMAIHPIRIYAGVRIGQMRFHTLVGEPVDYTKRGSYVGSDARGPVPSKFYNQFKK